jgi:hypothetical protein
MPEAFLPGMVLVDIVVLPLYGLRISLFGGIKNDAILSDFDFKTTEFQERTSRFT